MTSEATVREIQGFIDGDETIPRSRFELWAKSESPATLESVIDAVSLANHRIEPPLDERAFFALLLQAVRISITRRGQSGPLSPYLLSGDVSSFLDDVRERLGEERVIEFASGLERVLRSLALRPLEEFRRRALVDGFLEHLLQREDIRALFDSWRHDPTLAPLHAEAGEWSSGK